ncbi:MAG: endonuclease domain-containing protein [Proteobacteria bacterium]|nr:endonuclease domain-containing protein [Pseudomonadota bacterium]
MAYPSHAELLARAKWMRANPTEAEKRLWAMLRNRRLETHKFKRQRIIAPYIVDFACLGAGLIIEADGSQHADNRADERRDAFLRNAGFRVLRFWNNDVLENSAGVFDLICAALEDPHPPAPTAWAPPSPRRGEGLEGASLA